MWSHHPKFLDDLGCSSYHPNHWGDSPQKRYLQSCFLWGARDLQDGDMIDAQTAHFKLLRPVSCIMIVGWWLCLSAWVRGPGGQAGRFDGEGSTWDDHVCHFCHSPHHVHKVCACLADVLGCGSGLCKRPAAMIHVTKHHVKLSCLSKSLHHTAQVCTCHSPA